MHVAINGWFLDLPHTGSGQYTRRLVEALLQIENAPTLTLVAPQGMNSNPPPGVGIEHVPIPNHAARPTGESLV